MIAVENQIQRLDKPPTKDEEVAQLFQDVLRKYQTRRVPTPVLPDKVLLGFMRDGRLQVHSPVRVEFIAESGHIVAQAVEFNEFGFGRNWSEALIDLQHAIAKLYFTLEEGQDCLGSDLRTVWATLQQKLRKR